MDIEAIIMASSYLGIFGLMALNGLASFPSSQVLYIVVGYFVGTGAIALLPAALFGAAGNTIGNIMLYEGVRKGGVNFATKFGLLRSEDVARVEIVFRSHGVWYLFVGKLLPAIKVFIPIIAGLAHVHRITFACFMMGASFLWALGFMAIGYIFGKESDVWQSYTIILVIVAGGLLFLLYRKLYAPSVTAELEARATSSISQKPHTHTTSR
jgi:membrane protein DedA with SNARE-associated domain